MYNGSEKKEGTATRAAPSLGIGLARLENLLELRSYSQIVP